jgi:hypothetical protein
MSRVGGSSLPHIVGSNRMYAYLKKQDVKMNASGILSKPAYAATVRRTAKTITAAAAPPSAGRKRWGRNFSFANIGYVTFFTTNQQVQAAVRFE